MTITRVRITNHTTAICGTQRSHATPYKESIQLQQLGAFHLDRHGPGEFVQYEAAPGGRPGGEAALSDGVLRPPWA